MKVSCHSGMTLVEVMIAMGVSAILMLGIAEMMTLSNKAAKNVSIATDYNNLTSLLTLALNNEETCRSAFGSTSASPVTFADSDTGRIANLDSVSLSQGGGANVLVRKGVAQNGLTITDLSLRIPNLPNGALPEGQPVESTFGNGSYRLYNANLHLSAQKGHSVSIGSQAFSEKSIPVTIILKNGSNTLYDCFVATSKEFITASTGLSPTEMCGVLFPGNVLIAGKGCVPAPAQGVPSASASAKPGLVSP